MDASTRVRDQSVSDPVFEVRDLNVRFDMDRGESRVIRDVTIDIEREEILGIVGESGSGKSMFASALLDAVVEPGVVTGDITYYPTPDEPVDLFDLSEEELRNIRWEEIAMVFQGAMSSWNPTMKIRKHFEETLSAHDWDIEEGMETAHQVLRDVYLEPDRVLDAYPHELSGGMKQRALIALAMVFEPNVLVMDEPTAALDLLMQRSILTLLNEIQEKYEITMVFITHDLPLVADLADRLSVMYGFQFVEVGSTDDILENAAHPYTRSLLNATPNLGANVEDMKSIPGETPDPVDVPDGCAYHPRCPLADDRCEVEDPPFHDAGEDHRVTCFYWDEAEEAVPFTLHNQGETE
jgi:oligopeptide/dipeptide ABC transporter ATP-binding protein